MSPERQRVVIADLHGFFPTPWGTWTKSPNGLNGPFLDLPDYLNDLNAIHEAKRNLLTTPDLCGRFNEELINCRPFPCKFQTDKWTWGQSAEIEAEALIRTFNKWEESA